MTSRHVSLTHRCRPQLEHEKRVQQLVEEHNTELRELHGLHEEQLLQQQAELRGRTSAPVSNRRSAVWAMWCCIDLKECLNI